LELAAVAGDAQRRFPRRGPAQDGAAGAAAIAASVAGKETVRPRCSWLLRRRSEETPMIIETRRQVLDYATLSALADRLANHAEDISPTDRASLVADLRQASQLISKHATLRSKLATIAVNAGMGAEYWPLDAIASRLAEALREG